MDDDINVTHEIRKAGLKASVVRVLEEITDPIPKDEAWAIYVRGKRVSIRGSKTVWRMRHHATTALGLRLKPRIRNLAEEAYGNYITSEDFTRIYKDFIQEMQDNGILEFRNVMLEEEKE